MLSKTQRIGLIASAAFASGCATQQPASEPTSVPTAATAEPLTVEEIVAAFPQTRKERRQQMRQYSAPEIDIDEVDCPPGSVKFVADHLPNGFVCTR